MPLRPGFPPIPMTAAGQYFWPSSPGTASGTSAALNNGNLRVVPWLVTRTITIDRIGTEIVTGTTADAGAKFRMGVYADNGNAYPGALLLDAGQIAADVVAVADCPAISLTLPPGLYWIGGTVQAVVTTQPTMRTVSTSWTPPVQIAVASSAAPTTGQSGLGYTQTGVTGALPGTFTTTVAAAGNAPRLHMRAA